MVFLEITEVPVSITVVLRMENYFLANYFKSIRLLQLFWCQEWDTLSVPQVKGRSKTIRVLILKIVKVN